MKRALLVVVAVTLLVAAWSRLWRENGPKAEPEFVKGLIPYAAASLDVYDSPEVIRHKYGQGTLVHTFPGSDIQAAMLVLDGRQCIAVRGTAGLKNALIDLETEKTADVGPHVYFHHGFYVAAHEIMLVASKGLSKDKPVELTGHSLGGAVALIMAYELSVSGFNVSKVITFGQPKAVTAPGVPSLAGLPITRVVLDEDPVPLVPPSDLDLSRHGAFVHVGAEVWLDGRGNAFLLEQGAASKYANSSFWVNLPLLQPEDHRMSRYLTSLSAAATPGTTR